MSVASVRPRSAADCLIRSAVDISHLRQQGNPCAGSSVTSDPVRGVIINGLGACAVGGGGNTSLFPGRATGTVPRFVVSTSTESLCHRVAVSTCQRKAKHNIIAPLQAPRPGLAIPHLALMLTTRRLMHARMS